MDKDLDQTFNLESQPELAEFIQLMADHSEEQANALAISQEFIQQAITINGASLMSSYSGDEHATNLGADATPYVPELKH